MEFRDLKRQYILHENAINKAILSVAEDAHYIGGAQVVELERLLADYVGVKYCISCANGTDALQLALMAWGLGPGDAIFVPDFTFFSTGEVVSAVGATPIFVDIDRSTYNMSPDRLDDAIKYVINNTDLRPAAIIPVDLFGLPADYPLIREKAIKYDLLVLEDAAQGFGGIIKGKKACGFGDISTTSFFPAKPLGCYGDGGAIFTNNDEWATILKSYKVHGKGLDKYDNIRIGMNSRLDTIQAAVLIEKLRFFDEEVNQCNMVAEKYNREMSDIPGVVVPTVPEGYSSSWAQYTILLDNNIVRSKVIDALKTNGIPAMIYYNKPMHLQEAFANVCVGDNKYGQDGHVAEAMDCPTTLEYCKRCLSIPMSAYVEYDDICRISNIIREVVTI